FISLESDSAVAVSLINKGCPPSHPCATIVSLINRLKTKDWQVQISQIYRQTNQIADWIADYALSIPTGGQRETLRGVGSHDVCNRMLIASIGRIDGSSLRWSSKPCNDRTTTVDRGVCLERKLVRWRRGAWWYFAMELVVADEEERLSVCKKDATLVDTTKTINRRSLRYASPLLEEMTWTGTLGGTLEWFVNF
ncbi:hypothetical protein A2U01_0005706, partial [Trifolium medium]|nr:hypothetical protein [Trifolium medium]